MILTDPIQIRLTGAGGQGLITAGIILADAALLDGRNVIQTQTYGPEARLGSSKSEVIISRRAIAYPQVRVPDVLLVLSEDAAKRYLSAVHENTLIIIDSTCVSIEGQLGASPREKVETRCGSETDEGINRLLHTSREKGQAQCGLKGHVVLLPITAAAVELGSKVVANVVALGALNELADVVTPGTLRVAVCESVPPRFRALNERALERGASLARAAMSFS